MTIQETIDQIYQDYEKREFEKVMSALPDNFRFHWPASPSVSKYSGHYSSKQQLLEQLELLAEDFTFNSYSATNILIDGNKAAAEVALNLTSNETGETFDATLAHFWRFENGIPVKLVEYMDSALINRHAA
ncbi:MAG: nuclear transport factor 2 family protein [Pseudomonadota bacterium]